MRRLLTISLHWSRSNFRICASHPLVFLKALDVPPTPANSFPFEQHRECLGVALDLVTVKDDLYFTLQQKESSVA